MGRCHELVHTSNSDIGESCLWMCARAPSFGGCCPLLSGNHEQLGQRCMWVGGISPRCSWRCPDRTLLLSAGHTAVKICLIV